MNPFIWIQNVNVKYFIFLFPQPHYIVSFFSASTSKEFYLQKYITYLRTRRVTISNDKNDDLRISCTSSDWLSKSTRRPIAARQMSWLCGFRTIVRKKNVLPLKWQGFCFFFIDPFYGTFCLWPKDKVLLLSVVINM